MKIFIFLLVVSSVCFADTVHITQDELDRLSIPCNEEEAMERIHCEVMLRLNADACPVCGMIERNYDDIIEIENHYLTHKGRNKGGK